MCEKPVETSNEFGVSLVSTCNWLTGWNEFSWPITQHSKTIVKQSLITINTQLKFLNASSISEE